jgi:hypothetical protein
MEIVTGAIHRRETFFTGGFMSMRSLIKNGFSGFVLSLLLIGTMNVSVSSAGPNASISGTVGSTAYCTYLNGKPLCTGALMPVAGCTVTVSKSGSPAAIVYSATSDNSGNYSIAGIAIAGSSDTFQIKASDGPGYSAANREIVVNAGQAQTVNLVIYAAFSNRGVTTNDSLSFTVSTDKSVYDPGDSIFVHYSIQNTSTHSIQYWYTPGCEGDLVFTGIKGDTVYWLGKNRACVTMMGQGSIAPDSTIAMKFAGVPATSAMDSMVTVTAKATTTSFRNSEAPIDIRINKPVVGVVRPRPLDMEKYSGFPSLFISGKKLALDLGSRERVSLSLYSLSGRKLAQLLSNQTLPAGENSLDLAGNGCFEGMVVVRATGRTFSLTKALFIR